MFRRDYSRITILRTLELLIGALMMVSAWLHLRNLPMFYLDAAKYRLAPAPMLPWVAITLPWLLLFSGSLLATRTWHPVGGGLGVLIFSSFSFAQGWVLLKGYEIECGCFGTLAREKVSWISILLPLALAVSLFFCTRCRDR